MQIFYYLLFACLLQKNKRDFLLFLLMEVAAMLITGFVALTSMYIILIESLHVYFGSGVFTIIINIGDFLVVVFCE